jgi:hypothetical protein
MNIFQFLNIIFFFVAAMQYFVRLFPTWILKPILNLIDLSPLPYSFIPLLNTNSAFTAWLEKYKNTKIQKSRKLLTREINSKIQAMFSNKIYLIFSVCIYQNFTEKHFISF